MKKLFNNWALIIAIILFFVPFFWLSQGKVDLGGDSGRLYFLDPLSSAISKYSDRTVPGSTMYAFIPYEIFLYLLKQVFLSPTILISFEHGLQLSMSFVSLYFIIKELLHLDHSFESKTIKLVALTCGIVYIGFLSDMGWVTSLDTHNQVFLNPLQFYLLLRYVFTRRFRYFAEILILTILFSGNFGYSAMPNILSFYPLSILFLLILTIWVFKKPVPWKGLLTLMSFYFVLHAFHIIPTVASILDGGGYVNNYIFSSERLNLGVHYFDVNRAVLGKLSQTLLQPTRWPSNALVLVTIPVITFLGFMRKKSKLLLVTGIFFAITFFLVSANITILGIKLYRHLFSIPGFIMFRSFNEKWHFVFSFFYVILFGISLHSLLKKKSQVIVFFLTFFVSVTTIIRILPFLNGNMYKIVHKNSNDVARIFTIDSNFLNAVQSIKTLPDDGNFLTLPLTSSYKQIVWGKDKGAYVGVSFIKNLDGKNDIAGLWSFGPYQNAIIDAIKKKDTKKTLQILSLLNIKYFFVNTDRKILSGFPHSEYYQFNSQKQDLTEDQIEVLGFFESLPVKTIYEKSFFKVKQMDTSVVRPTIYVPEAIYASQAGVLNDSIIHSAYVDESVCSTTELCKTVANQLPTIEFVTISPANYKVQITLHAYKKPFLVILSNNYQSSWNLTFDSHKEKNLGIQHIMANGYANGWIISPNNVALAETEVGTISFGFDKYFFWGRVISIISLTVLSLLITKHIILHYGNRK